MINTMLPKEFDYFLLVAEELNITKAAQRAFISQQALSKYIKSLENRYETELFYRKPYLHLTPAGEILFRRAKQLRQMTDALSNELDCIKKGIDGQIHFGISYGRAFDIVPKLLSSFRHIYPQVKITVSLANTLEFRRQILAGEMDIAVGLSPEPAPELETIEITKESIYLAITDRMLQRYFPDNYPDCKYRFRNGVDLHEFEHIPFCFNPSSEHIRKYMNQYFEKENLHLSFMVITGSNELNINLCDSLGCFCLQFLLPHVKNYNQHSPDNQINIFPIPGLSECNTITLMYRKDRQMPQYLKHFTEVLQQIVSEQLYIFSSDSSKQSSFLLPWQQAT